MQIKESDGGLAFPVAGLAGEGGILVNPCEQEQAGFGGMSLRDYFVAHAPAEPQPWFEPRMPEKPKLVNVDDWFKEQGDDVIRTEDEAMLRDWVNDECYNLPRHLAGFQNAYTEAHKALQAWHAEYRKQRLVQWPYAWAMEQITMRKVLTK